jgi:hypothetical protein
MPTRDVLPTTCFLQVRHVIGPFATPDYIILAPVGVWSLLPLWAVCVILFGLHQGLPKTRSGKIMRRILRKIISQEVCAPPLDGTRYFARKIKLLVVLCSERCQTDSMGDITTLADPGVVADLITRANAAIAGTKK